MQAVHYLLDAPVTCALAAGMTALFGYMWNYRIGLEAVCLSYAIVARERQYYRLVTAAVTHVSAMHILFNMGSLLNLAPLEAALGSAWYAETTLLLLYASMACWMGVMHLAVTRYGQAAWADAPVVGYSGVLFGWMTVAGMLQPAGWSFLGLPVTLSPFVSLALVQLIVPRASFLGHLAGIAAGYAVGWGLLEGARGYWLCVGTLGAAGACLLSLRGTPLGPAVARLVALSPELLAQLEGGGGEGGAGAGGGSGSGAGGRARIVGGVLTQWRGVGREELAASAATAAPLLQAPAAPAAAAAHSALPVAPPAAAAAAGGAQPGQQSHGSSSSSSAAAAHSSARSTEANDPAAALLSRHV